MLLERLKHYGIDGKLYKWIESFLTNRKHKVVIDGVQSDDADVESGVPQGTVLGPVFFIIYIKGPQVCRRHKTHQQDY